MEKQVHEQPTFIKGELSQTAEHIQVHYRRPAPRQSRSSRSSPVSTSVLFGSSSAWGVGGTSLH